MKHIKSIAYQAVVYLVLILAFSGEEGPANIMRAWTFLILIASAFALFFDSDQTTPVADVYPLPVKLLLIASKLLPMIWFGFLGCAVMFGLAQFLIQARIEHIKKNAAKEEDADEAFTS